MDFPHGETVTIVRDAGTDQYGDLITGTPARIPIPGCAIAPGDQRSIAVRGRDGAPIAYTVYAPSWSPTILHTDRLEVRGDLLEVDGYPATWRSPFTGWGAGVEVGVKGGQG